MPHRRWWAILVGNNFLFEELASLRLRNAIGGADGRRQLTFPLERRADINAKKLLASVIACCARASSTWGSKINYKDAFEA
jgi:hypothetical protein